MKRLISFLPRPLLFAVAGLALGAFALAGCDSVGSSSGGSNVDVGFASSSPSSSTSATESAMTNDDPLDVTGSNGTLRLDDIRLVVSDVEVEAASDSADFELERPQLLDLPLNTTNVTRLVTDQVPPGLYEEFEFEVEDVGLDADDDEDELQSLRDEIDEAGFSNWPDEASMVAVGTFTPDGGESRSFTTYFDAEIEVEIEMDPPFEVGEDGASRTLTVTVDPSLWFTNSDGSVQDLSTSDFQTADDLVEFEAEFENGVTEIEFD